MAEENVEFARSRLDDWNAFMSGELTAELYAERFDPQIGATLVVPPGDADAAAGAVAC